MKDWEFILRPLGGLTAALALAAVTALVLFAARKLGKVNNRQGRIIHLLRFVSLLLLCALVFRPELLFTTKQKQVPTLVVLLDRSRSMLTPDGAGGKSRWQELKKAVDAAKSTLKSLEGEFEIKTYTFAEDLRSQTLEGESWEGLAADGRLTALGSALQEALAAEAGRPIAAAFVLTDGAPRVLPPRDLFPPIAARLYADSGCPIIPVRFGEARAAEQSRDISLLDLSAPNAVFVKNEFVASASAKASGFANQELPVELLFEQEDGSMKPVDTTFVRTNEGMDRQAVALKHLPGVSGEFKITLRAKEQPGELVTSNNSISTFVTVKPGGLNVLYLESSIRPESRFLRTSLDASADIRLQFERIDLRADASQRQVKPEWFAPGAFDVYLLGDIAAEAFTQEELAALRDRVNGGAGFGMLGGWYSFGAGGYAESPLAEVLPIETNRLEKQPRGEPPTPDLHIAGPVAIRPAPGAGGMHYLMKLATAASNEQTWADLPPLLGANKFSGVKRAALVLAESPKGEPLIAVAEFGSGRTLAFAGDTTYQWVLKGKADLHRKYWRQMILWLAKQDQKAAGSVWVELESRRFRPQSRVEFRCGAVGADGLPILEGEFVAEITLPGKRIVPLPLTRQDDHFTGAFVETMASGDYTVRVRGRRGGEDLGAAQTRFLIYDQDFELDNPAADPGMLSSIASLTKEVGGKVIAPEQLESALREMAQTPAKYEIEIRDRIAFWSHSAVFWTLAVLLTLEWFFRKKWGLV